jgi:ribosome-binding ATPase YchF (GTP1/OBG family)
MLTDKEVLIANYPFSTIDPNIGFVEIYDERVLFLKNFFHSVKTTFSNLELVDIAGIVRGASQKVGLGGEFLSHIRSLDLICHVVRCFEDNSVLHVESKINSVRDFAIIQLEFILADIQQIEKRLEKLQRLLKKGNDKQLTEELDLLTKIIEELKKEIPISQIN